mgnify:CR=1 FL=1
MEETPETEVKSKQEVIKEQVVKTGTEQFAKLEKKVGKKWALGIVGAASILILFIFFSAVFGDPAAGRIDDSLSLVESHIEDLEDALKSRDLKKIEKAAFLLTGATQNASVVMSQDLRVVIDEKNRKIIEGFIARSEKATAKIDDLMHKVALSGVYIPQ